MIRYCDKCKKPGWPKDPPSYMGNFKCAVCGEITWCHQGPDTLEKQIEELRKQKDAIRNENRDDKVAGIDVHNKKPEIDKPKETSDSLRVQQLRKLKRDHRPRRNTRIGAD